MNKKIKMFIIFIVFALIISCKNDASSEDLKNLGQLEQNVEGKVKGFLDTKKEELSGGLKALGGEVSSKVKELMQADGPQVQVAQDQGAVEDLELKEIEKKIEELKGKIDGKDNEKLKHELKEIEDRFKNKKENRKHKAEISNEKSTKLSKENLERILVSIPQLSKENLELGLTSLSNLVDIFSGLKNEFGEIAHKGFFLVYELYSHYTLIYKANIKNENISIPLHPTLTLINQKINNLIDSVNSNSDETILKISNDLKFDEEGTPIYKKKERLYVK